MLKSDSFCQEIPNEFYQFEINKIKNDAGLNWERNSLFGPQRFNNNVNKTSYGQSRFGFELNTKGKGAYFYNRFTLKNNFHGYIYSRLVNNPNAFNRYTGVERKISRLGFTSGETDLSGICYENEWILIQVGRGRQSWGAGNDIQLANSENSPAYDYGILGFVFRDFRFRSFNGFLESDSLENNRYISGRGLEWKNDKILIGVTELVIYSGRKRPLDVAYLNPLTNHLEVELNERQNSLGTDSGNGVWQLSFDYINKRKIRLSYNLLIDEFILDKSQKEDGKANGMASSVKIVYNLFVSDSSIVNLYISSVIVGKNTFRHEDGLNNFVHRGQPLGWHLGSDSKEIEAGMNIINNNSIVSAITIGYREIGDNNLLLTPYLPYENYLANSLQSGRINKVSFLNFNIEWWLRKYISVSFESKIENSTFQKINHSFNFKMNMFFLKDY